MTGIIDAAIRFVIIAGVIGFVIMMVVIFIITPIIYPIESKTVQEPDKRVVDLVDSIDEYKKTNEIMKTYSTENMLKDILDDKTTALDDRIKYHSMAEAKDGMNKDDLLYIVGEIEYEVTACEQNTHPTGIAGLMESLRYDIEDKIKSGYGKDSSIMPILERAKVAINTYSDCIDKSGNQ